MGPSPGLERNQALASVILEAAEGALVEYRAKLRLARMVEAKILGVADVLMAGRDGLAERAAGQLREMLVAPRREVQVPRDEEAGRLLLRAARRRSRGRIMRAHYFWGPRLKAIGKRRLCGVGARLKQIRRTQKMTDLEQLLMRLHEIRQMPLWQRRAVLLELLTPPVVGDVYLHGVNEAQQRISQWLTEMRT